MRRLLIQILIFVALIYITVKTVAYLCRQELDPSNYLAAISSKHRLLDASTKIASSSRIIVIGDSSLPFGFDASLAEKELKNPVINMGLHAAFGLEFILKEIAPDVKSGDKVVLVIHYYPNEADINEGVICHALDFYPEMYRRLDLNPLVFEKQKFVCDLKRTRRFILNRLSRSGGTADMSRFDFKTWALDGDGDFKDELYENPAIKFNPGANKIDPLSQKETISLLNDYDEKFRACGAELSIIYPPFPKTVYKDNALAINGFDMLLRRETEVAILNHPADMVFDDDYFFNSLYHLTSKGKSQYTEIVVNLIGGRQ